MTNRELGQYLLQSLNMGLGSIIQGETSYTNSFDCKIMEGGFLFLPRLPAVISSMMISILASLFSNKIQPILWH